MKTQLRNGWKDLKKDAFSDISEKEGVYFIRLSTHNNSPFPINRFLGTDNGGILEIGRAKNTKQRLQKFFRAYCGSKTEHSEAKRLFLLKKFLDSGTKIQFSFIVFKDYINKEASLLGKYFYKYGELPVLNNSLPKLKVIPKK